MIEGRIIKGVGGLYTVAAEDGLYECSMRGIFRKQKLDPAIGDIVGVEVTDAQARTGAISRVAKRKNSLKRPRVANIDQLIMVFAVCRPALNADLVDRFLITAEHEGTAPVICFSKADLLETMSREERDGFARLAGCYAKAGYPVALVFIAPCGRLVQPAATVCLMDLLAGKLSVFAGPSGVGKSTIINAIVPSARMETGLLSEKIQRGRHTTRHTELLEAFPGSFVADSPGFSALDIKDVTQRELPELFPEFRPHLGQCRFSDCRHLSEPDCMVKDQVGHTIDPARYERYVNFMKLAGDDR